MLPGSVPIAPAGERAPVRAHPGASAVRGEWASVAPLVLAAASLFVLTRPYRGVVHDAMLYVGAAAAAGDPDGLGRDILFAHDGQFGFSAFPVALRWAVEFLGADVAAASVYACGLAVWFVAALALLPRLLEGRRVAAVGLVLLFVLPPGYGGLAVFSYAEPFATPRPYGEAAVLAGLAALLAGRTGLAFVILLAGAALHPIMVLPGLGIWILDRCRADRRVAAAGVAATVAFLVAGWAGLPVARRAFEVADPVWTETLSANSYLFETAWSGENWARAAVRFATLAVAYPFLEGPRGRFVVGSACLLGAAGVAVSFVAGDLLSVTLALQVQPWRATWLVSALAAATLPVAALGLWRLGPVGRFGFACLGLAWLLADVSVLAAIVLAVVAVGSVRVARSRPDLLGAGTARAAVAVLCLAAAFVWMGRAYAVSQVWDGKPAGMPLFSALWTTLVLTLPVAAAMLTVLLRGWTLRPVHLAGLAAAGLALAVWNVDDRASAERRFDGRAPDPELVRLLPEGPGEILWLQSLDPKSWTRAGRPSWVSHVQGAAMVFSRELATVWADRTRRLAEAGLSGPHDREAFRRPEHPTLRPTTEAVEAFCARPDAPAALVAPLDGRIVLPPGRPTSVYRTAFPEYGLEMAGGRLGWRVTDSYAVMRCGGPSARSEWRGAFSG